MRPISVWDYMDLHGVPDNMRKTLGRDIHSYCKRANMQKFGKKYELLRDIDWIEILAYRYRPEVYGTARVYIMDLQKDGRSTGYIKVGMSYNIFKRAEQLTEAWSTFNTTFVPIACGKELDRPACFLEEERIHYACKQQSFTPIHPLQGYTEIFMKSDNVFYELGINLIKEVDN